MKVADRLKTLKEQVMAGIGGAARKHDTRRINMLTRLANRIEEDERVLSELEGHIVEYQREISGAKPVTALAVTAEATLEEREKESGRASKHSQGREARRKFVNDHQRDGVQLVHQGGKVYRTPGGKRVGIPFANELEGKPGRWFLGLKDGNYDAVILLCSRAEGEALEFVMPGDFLKGFWRSLSRHAGEVKFNLIRDGANFYLLVPPQGRESINRFLRAYQPLKD